MEIRKKLGAKKAEKSLEISAFLVFSRSDLNRPKDLAGAGVTHTPSLRLAYARLRACIRTPTSLHTQAYELAYASLRACIRKPASLHTQAYGLAGKEMLRILSHPLALRGVLRQAPAPAKGKKKPTAQGGGLFLCACVTKSPCVF